MFDGVPLEQFRQFISTPSSRIPTNSSLIQTTPISTPANLNFLSFDPLLFTPTLPTPHHHQSLFQSQHFLRTPTRDHYNDTEGKVDQEIDINDSWSNDEVIQLLRIKSSSENWFRDLTWDHVSRKLAELGYKRSAQKCKEKFEDETCRSFGSTIGYNKDSSRYLISEELDEHLYNNADQNTHHDHITTESPEDLSYQENAQVHEQRVEEQDLEVQGQKDHFIEDVSEIMMQKSQDNVHVINSKKRKRKHKKFKMVKGLCVDLVKKMMAQQEEMHKKLLDDMRNREEEKIKREEAWRKEETERVKREIHIREHEQEMAKDRQSTITEFLNKITSFDQKIQIPFDMNLQELQTNLSNINKQIPLCEITKIPSSEKITENPHQNQSTSKDDIGKRWPRDEVLALINIRSNVNNGLGGNNEDHQGYIGNNGGGGGGGVGGSLWERISQGMLELGYKRSAKRCKEKWENINKYFRKTKDANKKRSLDSRTCPYYHQLSILYNQEKQASNSVGLSFDDPEKCVIVEITPEN
ncbi:trihelix transcription factor GTL2 [Lactuca sativa]|uniref:Myb-like domain-containing protein n=1 Tax=Lactuca sativa TaxID=4236 RepID=A0A9R1W435_LACSA|nr:trihelix transcription factor GTL2 [Lactuca sativa]KAJ0215786.1 hypothetical protein LSAT_V11C300155630 [Lactuca sativa]